MARDFCCDAAQQHVRRGRFGGGLAAQFLQAECHAMTLADRLAGTRTGGGEVADLS